MSFSIASYCLYICILLFVLFLKSDPHHPNGVWSQSSAHIYTHNVGERIRAAALNLNDFNKKQTIVTIQTTTNICLSTH